MNRRSFLGFLTISPLGFLIPLGDNDLLYPQKRIEKESGLIKYTMERFVTRINQIINDNPNKKFNIEPHTNSYSTEIAVNIYRVGNGPPNDYQYLSYYAYVDYDEINSYYAKENQRLSSDFLRAKLVDYAKHLMSGHLN